MYKQIALLFFSSIVTCSSVYSQALLDKEITVNNFNGTTGEILDWISKQGGFTFSYSNQIDIDRKVKIEGGTGTIRNWLDKIFGVDKVEYVFDQNKIILKPKKKAKTATSNNTISGYVRDAGTGEELIGATVTIKELPSVGVTTNAYGFYSISVPEGNYTVVSQFIGYQPKSITIVLQQNTKLDFIHTESATELDAIEVTAEKEHDNITNVKMGIEKIEMSDVNKIPVIFGEKDVLKIIQLRPGVKSVGEGNSGFYVRGGAADQNLIILDEATVYNASHLLGFFSVFNADALKDVTLYKGSQPAAFGGRLSSVLDIRMKDGGDKKFGVEGGIGLISSRLKLDGPIAKGKGSFMISARRTYADLFLKLSPDTLINKAKIYFYDINAKANYRIDDNNRIYVSGYFGKDELGEVGDDQYGNINWGNATGTVRWNHLFTNKMFSNTSMIFSNYDYKIDKGFGGTRGEIISRIQDYNFKQDFQYFPNTKNELKFGYNSIYHKIIPGAITSKANLETDEFNLPLKFAWSNAAYISHEWKPKDVLSLEYGARLTSFSIIGPGIFKTYDSSEDAIDSTSYSKGEFVKTYFNIEPRFAANFIINDRSSVKTAYGRNTQNLHLLSNSTSGNPTDLWIPSSNNVKPEISDQVSFGYFQNFKNNMYEFSTEIYYKHFQNQIDYKDNSNLDFNDNAEAELLLGKGRAYGIEFLLQKRSGRLNGWISYTLARTEKKINEINNGQYYPAKQDRKHDISIVGTFDLSKKLTLSATWVYYTGNAVTFPSGKYEIGGRVVNYYTERNGSRMPDYHRLDLGVTWLRKKTEKFESSWNFSLYNAYGRKNANTITFEQTTPTTSQAIQETLFRWVPSISYNFKF
ncbi:MAG: TonB-dependent receptor [Chryseolinea sp.]